VEFADVDADMEDESIQPTESKEKKEKKKNTK
jgi:hypothetical protein